MLDAHRFDLVLTDMRLGSPYGTGVDVARASLKRRVRVLAMSDHQTAPAGIELVMKDALLDRLPGLLGG